MDNQIDTFPQESEFDPDVLQESEFDPDVLQDLDVAQLPTLNDVIDGVVENVTYVILPRKDPNLEDRVRVRMNISNTKQEQRLFIISEYIENGELDENRCMSDVIHYRNELEEKRNIIRYTFQSETLKKGKIMGVKIGIKNEKICFTFCMEYQGSSCKSSLLIDGNNFSISFDNAIKKYLLIRNKLGKNPLSVDEKAFLYGTFEEYKKAYSKKVSDLKFRNNLKPYIKKGIFDENGMITGITYKNGVFTYKKEGKIAGKNGNTVRKNSSLQGYNYAFGEILEIFCRENCIDYFGDISKWLGKQSNKYHVILRK